MRHIEWIGLPGSGKSTLSAEVVRRIRPTVAALAIEDVTREYMRRHSTDPLWRRLNRFVPGPVVQRLADPMFLRSADHFTALRTFLVDHPRVLEVALRAQRRRAGYELGRELVLGWLLQLAAQFTVAARLPGDPLVLMAEGFANRAVTLMGHRFGPEDEIDLREYIAAVPMPRAVVYLSTPPDVCARRLTDWSARLEDVGASDRIEFLNDAQRCLQMVAESLLARSVPVHVIENNDHEVAIETVTEALAPLITSPGHDAAHG